MADKNDNPITLTSRTKSALSFEPPARASAGGIGVAPLVDIVFLLICFYLFVTQSIQANEDPSIRLPVVTYPALADEQPAELVVNVAADGSISLNNRPVPIEELRALLIGQQRHSTEQGRPLTVAVRIDRRQKYRRLDEVLTACRGAGRDGMLLRVTETDVP